MNVREDFVESEGHRLGYLAVNEHLLAEDDRPVVVFIHGVLAYERRAYLANPRSQRLLENIEPNVSEQNFADLFPLFNGIGRLEIADQLGEINIPCHIFAGTHDPIVPAKQSLLLSSRIPGAKTTAFQEVGHMPFIEDTDHYCAALEEAVTAMSNQATNQTG